MDIGNPSNFVRIQEMYGNDLNAFKKDFSSFTFSDEETIEALKHIYNISGYVAEPHLGLKKQLEKNTKSIGVFLETAHPVKFLELEIVEETLKVKLPIPPQIESVMGKDMKSIKIKTYENLKAFLR